ncbi:MAG: MFS transporter [Candidatus Merdivicinus sp.]|jgi:UMF1 family MFS transporter
MSSEKLSRIEKNWILYDVANSAFILLVSTTIPIFFRSLAESEGFAPEQATGIWGTVTSIAVLILAVLSPILGALADYNGMKKKLFSSFLLLGVAGLLSLSIATEWVAFLVLFVIARIGYTACNVFYDSMLTDITPDEKMDMVSSHGFAWGYIGSCIPFILGILLIFTLPFGLTTQTATQLSFLITAIWWIGLTIPLLRSYKQTYFLENRKDKISHVFRRIGVTFGKIRQNKRLLFYIIAYFCYIDGVNTIISMSTSYGAEVGISDTNMILALLLTQFIAFPCAIFSGKLAKKYGALKLIKIFICCYIAICLFGYQLDQAWEFWVLAVAVGMCQGGIQALSRSYYGKLIPKEESNEYFGFFDIFGKFADFFGPLIIAFCAFAFGSSTYGILALIALFAVGFILVLRSEKAA